MSNNSQTKERTSENKELKTHTEIALSLKGLEIREVAE